MMVKTSTIGKIYVHSTLSCTKAWRKRKVLCKVDQLNSLFASYTHLKNGWVCGLGQKAL